MIFSNWIIIIWCCKTFIRKKLTVDISLNDYATDSMLNVQTDLSIPWFCMVYHKYLLLSRTEIYEFGENRTNINQSMINLCNVNYVYINTCAWVFKDIRYSCQIRKSKRWSCSIVFVTLVYMYLSYVGKLI